MCYCNTSATEILDDIINENVPDDALANGCCWRRVCQVRGWNFKQIAPETWGELCRHRGYIFGRQNPRGF